MLRGETPVVGSVSVRETLSPALQLRPELFHRLKLANLVLASSKAKAVPSTFRTVIDIRLPSASRRSPFSAASGARHTAR